MSRGLLISAVVVALVAGAAFATPTMTVSELVTKAPTGVTLTANQKDGLDPITAAGTYTVHFSIQVSNLAAGETVYNCLVGPTPSATSLVAGSFAPAAAIPEELFATDGTDVNNLPVLSLNALNSGFIFAQINSGMSAYVLPGEAASSTASPAATDGYGNTVVPNLIIGTMKFAFDGTATATLTSDPVYPGLPGHTLSTFQGNTTIDDSGNGNGTAFSYTNDAMTFTSNTITFSAPEPATMALLVVGGIGALLRRRK